MPTPLPSGTTPSMPKLTDQQRQWMKANAFVDDPDKTYSESLAALPGGGILPEYQNDKTSIPGADLPGQNPLAKSMYFNQLNRANDLSNNFQNYSDSAYNPVANQARADLTAGKRSIRNNYNSRGLLSSGMEQSGEGEATKQTQNYLTGVRSNINQGITNDITGAENNAYNAAAGLAQPGPQTAQIYQQGVGSDIARQMSDAAASSQAYGSIGQGLGALGGAGLASAMYSGGQTPYTGSPLSQQIANYNPLPAYPTGGRSY